MTRKAHWTNQDVHYVTESPLGYAVSGGPLDLMAMPISDLTDEQYRFIEQAIEAGRVKLASR